MIDIIIAATLEIAGLPCDIEAQFSRDNSFPNPKRETLERLGKWAGNEPKSIELYSRRAESFILPRGYLPFVIHTLKQRGLKYAVQDCTVCPTLREPLKARGELYPYQARALADLLRWQTGVLESPTGSGKTNILLSAVPRLGTPALVCVHTTELLNQTCERIRSWLGIEPGVIAGQKAILRPVTVGMIQTLARRNLDAEGIARYFGAVLVDEAHHAPAMTWARILAQLPAKYKYGFTATAWRKDGLQFLLWRLIGNKSARIAQAEVQAVGKIVWPDVETVLTDYSYPLADAGEWSAMLSDLVNDRNRNELIEREVRERLNGSRALVLTHWLYRHWKQLPFARRLSRRTLRFSENGLQKWQSIRRA